MCPWSVELKSASLWIGLNDARVMRLNNFALVFFSTITMISQLDGYYLDKDAPVNIGRHRRKGMNVALDYLIVP